MYEKKYLILIKGEDKTTDVTHVKYVDKMWEVTFVNGNTYTYGYKSVEKYYDPKIVNTSNVEIKISGEYVYNIHQILFFKLHAKLFFINNTSALCWVSQIEMKKIDATNKSTDVFKYLKELSNILKIKVDDDNSFLGKQFGQIITVNKESVLNKYINKQITQKSKNIENILLPFGVNISQEKATRIGLNRPFSIIEGPPGTGKTQTILNLIANAIIRNKSIAIVSNNNSATVNIQEKLATYDLSFICAFLGSRENKDKFIESQDISYPEMKKWEMSETELLNSSKDLKSDLKEILILNDLLNQKSKASEDLGKLLLEYKHYQISSPLIDFNDDIKLLSKSSFDISTLIEEIMREKRITKIYKFFFHLKHKIKFKNVYIISKEKTINKLNHLFYTKLINELNSKISSLDNKLKNADSKQKMADYQKLSMKLFKAFLFQKFGNRDARYLFDNNDLYLRLDDFIKEYPVILSTTHSLRNISKYEYLYDYVVIDEASQVDIVSGALALSVAKQAVIVGDSMQLPHVVNSNVQKSSEFIFNKYDINKNFKYTYSLLDSIKSIYGSSIPTTLLKEHYRCNPEIIGFCNQKFYHSDLIIHTTSSELQPLSVYISAEGNHARGNYNQRQIDIILQEVLPQLDKNDSIGIITPFREQADKLIEAFRKSDIEADTVHKYQGREKDIIIISTVSNSVEANSFVDNKNLINVAVSRAKKRLILVTSNDMLENKNTNISNLVAYIKYHNFEVLESKVLSVFDALYKNHSDSILKQYQDPKKVSEYKSENIIYELLSEILSHKDYSSLGMLLHYPLSRVIRDYSLLTEEEYKYASNYLTHVDFLLYNKLTKQPVLVVEVDGYAFHNNNKKQLIRDNKKDNILRKYGIQYLRLNTTGSNERDRIIDSL